MCILRESKGKGLAVPKEWRVEGGKRRQCSPGGYFRHVLPTQNLTRRLLLGIGDSGKWEPGRKNERRRGGGEQGIDRNTKERDEKQTEKETWLLAMVSNWTEQPYLSLATHWTMLGESHGFYSKEAQYISVVQREIRADISVTYSLFPA